MHRPHWRLLECIQRICKYAARSKQRSGCVRGQAVHATLHLKLETEKMFISIRFAAISDDSLVSRFKHLNGSSKFVTLVSLDLCKTNQILHSSQFLIWFRPISSLDLCNYLLCRITGWQHRVKSAAAVRMAYWLYTFNEVKVNQRYSRRVTLFLKLNRT